MPPRPDEEPDFADALDALIEQYAVLWETPLAEIQTALSAQLELISAEVGSVTGFAPADQVPSETPDEPDPPPSTTPTELPPE